MAEIERYLSAYRKRKKREAKEKASYDYILADLIGASCARLMSKSAKFPKFYDVYGELFKEEIQEERQKEKNELTVQRFLSFANAYNKKFQGGETQ